MARLMTKQLPETHKGKCVIACVFKKFKFVSIPIYGINEL